MGAHQEGDRPGITGPLSLCMHPCRPQSHSLLSKSQRSWLLLAGPLPRRKPPPSSLRSDTCSLRSNACSGCLQKLLKVGACTQQTMNFPDEFCPAQVRRVKGLLTLHQAHLSHRFGQAGQKLAFRNRKHMLLRKEALLCHDGSCPWRCTKVLRMSRTVRRISTYGWQIACNVSAVELALPLHIMSTE